MKSIDPIIQQFIQAILPTTETPPPPAKTQGIGEAPVNIALAKYWGKRDPVLNLPMNSSLSISLLGLGTQTTLSLHKTDSQTTKTLSAVSQLSLNQQPLPAEYPFFQRVANYLRYFQPQGYQFQVETHNSVPTGAGLASSASGYAALVNALNDLFQWQLPPQKRSLLARLGSGSASRSVYSGFALWHKGEQADGLDSYADPIDATWPDLCIGLIKVDISEKPIGSTDGMQRTVKTCELYQNWPNQAEKAVQELQHAIQTQDFQHLGETAEHNALTMHATMIATWPPIVYWQPNSLQAMQTIWALRQQGHAVYFTMDAGPNLKLLFPETEKPAIKQAFGEIEIIQPFKCYE